MKIKRECPGYYEFTNDHGRKGVIRCFDGPDWKGSTWYGWWIVEMGPTEYSDPVRTYREAKRIATNWE